MTDYLVRASALQGIRPTLENLGSDADTLLRKVGLADAERDPDTWISYRRFLLLLDEAARLTHCPHFGLQLSLQQDIRIFGVVGFIIQQAPDLRTALRELSTHMAHHNQGASLTLQVEGDVALWCFNCKLEGHAPIWQQSDLAAGIGLNLMRLLRNPRWTPKALYLPHAPPENLKPYKERFQCPLFFNWHCMATAFDAADLDSIIHAANPQLHRVLDDHLRSLQVDFADDYCGQVRHIISQALTTGDCSIDKVAGFLSINKRTLQRQLKTQGTSYKALLEEVRFDIARRYLRESSGSLTALADMLGYSELSVFSNAFRQRYGISPRTWKNQQVQH